MKEMNLTRKLLPNHSFAKENFYKKSVIFSSFSKLSFKGVRFNSQQTVSNNDLPQKASLSTVQMKKKIVKKKKKNSNEGFRVAAFSTAEEYNLEKLAQEITASTLFKLHNFSLHCENLADAIHAFNRSNKGSESQHLFFFRGGSVVMWNFSDSETQEILNILKSYEDNSFDEDLIHDESETMRYTYSADRMKTGIVSDVVVFSNHLNLDLEKYTVSNAMAQSVYLGIFEANLQRYIDTMEPVTEDLKSGKTIKMSRDEVLQKTGQLFALRHNINLNSDLLDTPDFYWEREELESLYQITTNYFCINKRTRIMNEKINHCIELVHLLSSHLNDKHHVRLEWMIIILIMVEVVFEVIHFCGR